MVLMTLVSCSGLEDELSKKTGNPDIPFVPDVPEIQTEAKAFDILDLDYPGLEKVKSGLEAKDTSLAAWYLLDFYRNRTDVYDPTADLSNASLTEGQKRIAEQALEYRFYVRNGGVESVDEATQVETYWCFLDANGAIDWSFLPEGYTYWTEFSYQKNRFQWMEAQAKAYAATRDEAYFYNWKEVLLSYMETYPCPEGTVNQMEWNGLQVSERISVLVTVFPYFIKSPNFTAEFLLQFLSILNDHIECQRVNWYHEPTSNIRLNQEQAVTVAGILHPELAGAKTWLEEGSAAIAKQLDMQFLEDGVHNEFDISYHFGETGLAAFTELYEIASANGKLSYFPDDYVQKLYKAAVFVKDVVYPNYSTDNFNDTRSQRVTKSVLLRHFRTYSTMFPEDEEMMWMANQGKIGVMPTSKVQVYPYGGYYMMRTGWDATDMMLVHKSNPNVDKKWHCQPDNGTISLYKNGRRFLPDAGVFTYDDPAVRATYASTYMHNTITRNKEDISVMNGKLLKQQTLSNAELIVTENPGYDDLTHRRAIFLVNNSFFVIVDEAYGSAADVTVNLNFKLCSDTSKDALGKDCCIIDEQGAHTVFKDDNNMIFKSFSETSDGYAFSNGTCYYSDEIDVREQRRYYQVDVTKKEGLAARFITVILPYGKSETFAENRIEATFTDNAGSPAGTFHPSGASVKVNVNGIVYNLSYTLN